MWSKRAWEKEQAKEGFCPCLTGRAWKLFKKVRLCPVISVHLKRRKASYGFCKQFPSQMRKGGRSETLPCPSDHVSAGLLCLQDCSYPSCCLQLGLWVEPCCDSQGCINSAAAWASAMALGSHVENVENTLLLYSRINRKQIHTLSEISLMLAF